MYVKPNSTVHLLTGIDLDNNYTNTIFFQQIQMQEAFFLSNIAYKYNNKFNEPLIFTHLYYVRNNSFKIEVPKDALYHVNYMMFKNENHKNKWFYAFVTDIKYINESTSEIFYQIDVMQTWYFEYEVLDSYVVREHVADDTIGANTVEENLPVPAKKYDRVINCSVKLPVDGDGWSYYQATHEKIDYNVGLNRFFKEYAVIVPSTVKLKWGSILGIDFILDDDKVHGYFYNGVYSGLNLNLLRKYKVSGAVTYGEATMIIKGITQIVDDGGEDTITGIYMCPIMFCKKPDNYTLTQILTTDLRETSATDAFDDWFHIHNQEELDAAPSIPNYWTISEADSCIEYEIKFLKGTGWVYEDKLNTVTVTVTEGNETRDETYKESKPKNNKLYTYPFSKLLITDNAGNSGDLRYEWFRGEDDKECYFKVSCSTVPNPLAQTMPLNYNYVDENVIERVTTDNFPRCAWSVSSFEAWIGKNKTNIIMDAALNTAAIPTQAVMAVTATNYLSKFLAGTGIGKAMTAEEKQKQYVTGANVGMLRGTNKFIGNMETDLKAAGTALDMPPRVHGESYNSIIFATGKSGFQYYHIRPTDEYCNIIDRYFDMFGYAVKTVKPVKRRNRKYWTYIQTSKCAIKGNLNQDIISEIEEIFNNGITFWVAYDKISDFDIHDPSENLILKINDYRQPNNDEVNSWNAPLGILAER